MDLSNEEKLEKERTKFKAIAEIASLGVQRLKLESVVSLINTSTRSEVLREIFSLMEGDSVDLSDKNSVASFLSKFQSFDAKLHAEFERDMDMLLSDPKASVSKVNTSSLGQINDEKMAVLQIILNSKNTLVTARAGSGKTTLLLHLIKNLIEEHEISKNEIVAAK